MKIIFSTDSISIGGKERQLAILTKEFINKGYQIYWICHKLSEVSYIREYGLENIPLLILKNREYFKGFFEFKKIVNEINPNIVMTWDAKSSFWCLLMYRFYPWTFINGCIRHGVRKNNFSHLFRTLISKSSPFVIANSEAGLKANLMSSSLNRRVIYNAIEVNKEKISLINENRDYYLNKISNGKYKFGFNGVVFLSVANLLLIKDYPTVIEALSRIKYNFIYFIAGEGPERGRIESLIVQKGLCNKVILLGRRTDISKILFCCDIFINSSKGEGCSNSILEAIAHRKYVVASNVGGTPEILPKELGVLFPFQNVDSLVVSLHRAIANYKYVDFQQYEMHLEAFNVKIIADSFEQTFLNWNK